MQADRNLRPFRPTLTTMNEWTVFMASKIVGPLPANHNPLHAIEAEIPRADCAISADSCNHIDLATGEHAVRHVDETERAEGCLYLNGVAPIIGARTKSLGTIDEVLAAEKVIDPSSAASADAVNQLAITPAPLIGSDVSGDNTFDPESWLAHFRDAGGWWAVDADARPWIGWTFQTEHHDITGRQMFAELVRDRHKSAAIHGHILASVGGA